MGYKILGGVQPRKKKINKKIYKQEVGGYASKGRAKEVAKDYRETGYNARVVKQTVVIEHYEPKIYTQKKTGIKARGLKRADKKEVSYVVYYRKKKKSKKKRK